MQLQFLNTKGEKIIYAIETQTTTNTIESTRNSAPDQPNEQTGTDSNKEGQDIAEIPAREKTVSKSNPVISRSATGWHTCGICLEDIFDDDLMVHEVCGGVLCRDCLQATASYHSGQTFPCPVS